MPSAATARAPSRPPSSSPIATSFARSASYVPANGFAITAIAHALRVGGSTGRPISSCVSSTPTTILRILAWVMMPSCTQSILFCLRRYDQRTPLQYQHGALDQAGRDQALGFASPARERPVDRACREIADRDSDRQIAEIAVVALARRRRAANRR